MTAGQTKLISRDTGPECLPVEYPYRSRKLECKLAADTVAMPIKLCNLPPMHAVASQVLVLSADPDVDLRRLASVMERDAAFAADVLFLANSSLFGFPQRMQVLRHAVAVLGIERVRALAVTVAMRGFLGSGCSLVHRCWEHSVTCALICEELAPLFGVTRDVAYSLGLMHDIGRLGFIKCYPKECEAVMSRSFDTVEEVLEAEHALLNVDHALAGAWLVKNWAFPASFQECCEHHHAPFSPEDSAVLQLVKAACRTADALGFTAIQYTTPVSYDDTIPDMPEMSRPPFPAAAELRERIESRLAVFR